MNINERLEIVSWDFEMELRQRIERSRIQMETWTPEDNRLLQAGRIAPVELDADEQERARPHTVVVKCDGREMYVPHDDYYVALNWLVANSGLYEFVRIEPTDSAGATEPRLTDASE